MDSLTHIALGAVVGEALMGRSIGKKALLMGAIAQSIPDIDFINSFFLDPSQNLLAHRGITHSFLFAAIVSVLLALGARRLVKEDDVVLSRWILFFGLEITIHLMLDACNAYGVGWFEPFSSARVSFNLLFVADPFFSLAVGVAAVVLMVMKIAYRRRRYWVIGSLVITSVYFMYASVNKVVIDRDMEELASVYKTRDHRYFTTPTPFNSWLWYLVAEADSGYYIGYRSVFDHSPTQLSFVLKQKSILDSLRGNYPIEELITFSQGYYVVDKVDSTVVFNDLRFGQVMGWSDPHAKFVFRYYLTKPEDNLLVMQRGRFSGWNRKSVLSMLRRIRGV